MACNWPPWSLAGLCARLPMAWRLVSPETPARRRPANPIPPSTGERTSMPSPAFTATKSRGFPKGPCSWRKMIIHRFNLFPIVLRGSISGGAVSSGMFCNLHRKIPESRKWRIFCTDCPHRRSGGRGTRCSGRRAARNNMRGASPQRTHARTGQLAFACKRQVIVMKFTLSG